MQKTIAAQLDETLAKIATSNAAPRLLLHCCCAPCASYVLEYLSAYFRITALFYNPNIVPEAEYHRRANELLKLTAVAEYVNSVDTVICDYEADVFSETVSLYRDEPEGGRRCKACFDMRLGETARRAKEGHYDYFTTTLTVSPHKNATILNETGIELGGQVGVEYLLSDFKKRNGYKRSVELSEMYGLYRQNYCGCSTEKRSGDATAGIHN